MNLFNRVVPSRRQAPLPPQRSVGASASPTAVLPDPNLTNLSGEWVVDPAHSRIGFSVRHAMVTTVRGCFLEYESRLYFDAYDPTRSRADITLFTSSVDTGVEQRDAHLVGRDFLDAVTYPRMRFTSTAVEQTDADLFSMSGELTIKGVTRPVVLDMTYIGSVTDPFGYDRVGFDGTTTINRSDWGLTYNSRLAEGGAMVSEKVRLQLDIAAIRTPPTGG
ncbi:YceI family protein [Streptomyces sp. 378]|uniref:YceI family protein n=1 Tax=unclassified Streptomyces TaxID=2593676 RepID=UPI0024C2A798|nr:YceI family protein [Streptomyces sp. 378]MDK1344559.1 YceI family protein [Streptomyces sp. 378]